MHRRVLIILLVLVVGYGYAQKPVDTVRYKNLPKHAVKFSPLSLITFYPSIQLAYEVRVVKNFSLQADVGYVINFNPVFLDNDNQFKNKRGTKLKAELRYYLPYSLHRTRAQQYVTLEPYLNTVRFNRETSVLECFDAECSAQFSRIYRYVVEYRERGILLKYGIQVYAKRVLFDFSGGLRLRDIYYDKPEFNENTLDENDELIDIPDETTRTVVEPVISIKIGYRIR